jgi:arylsulfatase A-like enzyme
VRFLFKWAAAGKGTANCHQRHDGAGEGKSIMKRRDFLVRSLLGAGACATARAGAEAKRLNILWIVAEDASPHLGCYGETAIPTPHLDALAAEGIRFTNAVVTCPVCSPARSALITGMYQTTIGSHNHRSQNPAPKSGGNRAYYASYHLPDAIPPITEYFREAGYYVCNGEGPESAKPGKTDYNFMTGKPVYDGSDWRDAPEGRPFFAQVQLKGGKSRPGDFEAGDFDLPPYYPDDPVMRRDQAEYLGSWVKLDKEAGRIVARLKEAGVYDNTVIFFLTDHGVSSARGKQFLYDDGIRIPLIVRFPGRRFAGSVREDLAAHIDLGPASLAAAGLDVPAHLQGRDLFAADYRERPFVVSARDRCDETLDTIRSVRTRRWKYIRNFQSFRPHMQYNQYKDGKKIVQHLRELHEKSALTPLQDRIFAESRPPEELYDLKADPFETVNLAADPAHAETLRELRLNLYGWMLETRDCGLFPEPALEDMGREHGSKYAAMKAGNAACLPDLIATIEAGERNDTDTLIEALQSDEPAQRYWACTGIGNQRITHAKPALETAAADPVPAVRVAAHLALWQLDHDNSPIKKLAELIDTPNLIVGMYAMNAIERTGVLNRTVARAAEKALANPYNPTQRYGKRLAAMVKKAQKKPAE